MKYVPGTVISCSKVVGFVCLFAFQWFLVCFSKRIKGVLFSLAAGKGTISLEILTATGHNSLIFVNLVDVK